VPRSRTEPLFRAFACAALALLACSACGCAQRAAQRRSALHVVVIKQVAFQPAELSVAPGDTVEWQNQDLVPHTSSATDSTWDSGDLLPDRRWRWVAARAGTFPYACRYHTNMHGTVRVGG